MNHSHATKEFEVSSSLLYCWLSFLWLLLCRKLELESHLLERDQEWQQRGMLSGVAIMKKKREETEKEEIKHQGCPTENGGSVFCLSCDPTREGPNTFKKRHSIANRTKR